MKNKVKKICLFGTSANPPTGKGGHVGVVEALLQLNAFDEIHIVPVYNHTFHSKRNQLIGYNHRIAMCELAFQELIKMTTSMNTQNENKKNDENENNNDCDVSSSATTSKTKTTKVIVSRAEEDSFNRICSILSSSSNKDGGRITEEEKSNLRVGTADLLEMLITQEQQQIGNNGEEKEEDVQVQVHHATEFSFCLGADTFMDLTDWKWKRSKDVLKLLNGRLVVVNRKQHTQHNQQQQQEGNSNNNNQQQQEQEQKLILLLRQRIDYINTSLNGQVILLDVSTLGNVSSSMARSLLSSSKNGDTIKNLKDTLPLPVVDYIRKHELYGSI
ncbi:Nucleotidylyl transferase [Fragilariopsis cylindrus CCMP1102]|uniref:Nucleotidylyl transferase n=1 Tax=Fragilariopsis cylindrus CCMP1102 TaxID=635003 RepID=A0A1E7EVB7_9STRA|nr:Nucleotidylyl transferase [Fragilariopsis cylindrus CCMP1102]|eukprot:OEU09799.1 Nucleotidylyl transferase [Fragilariopsis cylindrus CCMP1102]